MDTASNEVRRDRILRMLRNLPDDERKSTIGEAIRQMDEDGTKPSVISRYDIVLYTAQSENDEAQYIAGQILASVTAGGTGRAANPANDAASAQASKIRTRHWIVFMTILLLVKKCRCSFDEAMTCAAPRGGEEDRGNRPRREDAAHSGPVSRD